MIDRRLENEIEHGKFLVHHNARRIWNWDTAAGKIRWKRRVGMLTKSLKNGMKVLEIGCGTGCLSIEIIKTPVKLTAIDISPELIKVASNNITNSSVQFSVENAYHMSFCDNCFDGVIGSSVLHHLDIDKSIKEIYRVLKNGSFIAFTEPNMMNPQIALQKNIPFLKKAAGDSPDETAFYRWSLKEKLSDAGFSSIEIIPFDFLHPRIPEKLISSLLPLANICERVPGLKEIAGSLYITAIK